MTNFIFVSSNSTGRILGCLSLHGSDGLLRVRAAGQLRYFTHQALNLILGALAGGGRVETRLILHLRHCIVSGRRQTSRLSLRD